MPTNHRIKDEAKLRLLLSLLNDDAQPNTNALTQIVRNIPLVNLNLKAMGYDLAQRLAAALPVAEETFGRLVGLTSRTSTQSDIESDWAAHWCRELKIPVIYHRKVWELAYVLQAIFETGLLKEGMRGLGFGCGVEPLPSYFAARGVQVTMTDLAPESAIAAGWSTTNQHASSLLAAFQPGLVEREIYDAQVSLQYVDMNAIPDSLVDYDFCWSICALEHLGTLANGLAFIEKSLDTLKPGGISVHTTELNIDSEGPTVDNWPTVLYQRRHFEQLASRLQQRGHYVAPLDFSLGDQPMDRFIDLPPYHHDMSDDMKDWLGPPYHLKVGTDGFACTCFGILIRKKM
jgi:2-polyprenyl-3-methyl-5-hydroxy-6-metoxy-1,4-benzoquinol methylase